MRYESIDIFKGIAVILMIIFHIFYFPNQYGFKEFNFDTPFLKCIARIAQIIFITGVGVNMYISYKSEEEKFKDEKNKDKKNKKKKSQFNLKQLKRIGKLSILAVFISIFSYKIFGNMFVKFGILHFMAFSSLLVMFFVDNQKIIISILILGLILKILVDYNKNLFINVPPKIAFISGFYSKYGAVDHFPLIPWIIYICIGILIGKFISNKYKKDHKDTELTKKIKGNIIVKKVEWCGKYSLEIYIIHWILLYLFFAHIYPKIKTNAIV